MSERPDKSTDGDRQVTVCDRCFCASCWHGIFMCDESRYAGTTRLAVSTLRQLNREHPDYYSPEHVLKVTGAING